MLVIGLTGGICSGKTTVSDLFKRLDINIIDADEISRKLLEGSIDSQPSTALEKVYHYFGQEFFDHKGYLIRQKLKQQIFKNKNIDKDDKKILEQIMHPEIFLQIKNEINEYRNHLEISKTTNNNLANYLIISIPLLLETADLSLFDRIIIVDVTEKTQLSRCMQRDNISENMINNIIKSQISRTDRLVYADDIINNELPITSIEKQVTQLHKLYQSLTQHTNITGINL